jgi:hypothetical protein
MKWDRGMDKGYENQNEQGDRIQPIEPDETSEKRKKRRREEMRRDGKTK